MKLICSTTVSLGITLLWSASDSAAQTTSTNPTTQSKVVPAISTPDSGADTSANTIPLARGTVFLDLDGDGKFGPVDQAAAGIKVSNGTEIASTDVNGRYELPLPEDAVLFVIKPTGFRTALNDQNLPKFFYIHKPNGSPQLKFPGSSPTGPLPQSIDFPLYQQSEPDEFRVILFGDPQPRNNVEVDYISHDVISELIGNPTKSAFGVSLGDLAFDNLDTFETLNQTVALIGIPWYNVIGNHDINYDSPDRKHINETYERVYGPSYYSYDYGQVHFVVLDNIDWEEPTEKIPQRHFIAGFGAEQLEFLKNDLARIPASQMVVLMMHIPIISAHDKLELFKLIETRPLCISIAGHTHDHQHLFLGPAEGFNGREPHHHIVNVTVSGSWWSGLKDDRGIPHTMMADGGPNGYSIMTFDGEQYRLDYKAAGRPASEQMRIHLVSEIAVGQTGESEVSVNVYNGSAKSSVEMAINDAADWVPLTKKVALDPSLVELFEYEQKLSPPIEPKMSQPKGSSHLWFGKLPPDLPPGTHLLRVRTTDMHGRTFHGHRSFRVSK